MTFDLGPFHFNRIESTGSLDVSLKAFPHAPCGFEYGYKDPLRGTDKPLIEFRIGRLMVLYFEKLEKGFEVWFMGFWVIKKS